MAVRAVREPSLPQPPDHLSPTAAAWWTAVVAEFDLEAHQLVILEAAADAYDRMLECRAIVLTEGAVVRDRYDKPKTHPAALLERDSRLSLARLIRELAFDVPMPDTRPNRRGGQRW
jgi:P27 family predicted phage terminase small subunit